MYQTQPQKNDYDDNDSITVCIQAQVALVRNLRGSSDDIINAGVAFPGMARVAELSKATWMIDKVNMSYMHEYHCCSISVNFFGLLPLSLLIL